MTASPVVYVEPGLYSFVSTRPYVATENLVRGDLITFWEHHGIFLGIEDKAKVVSVDVCKHSESFKATVQIKFELNDERRVSELTFGDYIAMPEGKVFDPTPENVVILKLLINSEIRHLPRLVIDGFYYNDGLAVIRHEVADDPYLRDSLEDGI